MIEKNGKRFLNIKKGNTKINNHVRDIASTLKEEGKGEITSDVTGSYTGITIDGEVPVQDADDL